MTEWSDEQARSKCYKVVNDASRRNERMESDFVVIGRALLTLEAEVERQQKARTEDSIKYATFCCEIADAADSRVPATAVNAVHTVRAERDAALAAVRELREALAECEWAGRSGCEGEVAVCPKCGGVSPEEAESEADFYGWTHGHVEGCTLQAILARTASLVKEDKP